MGIRLRDADGILRTITRIRVRDTGGTLRTVQTAKVRDATATLRTVFTYLSASLAPNNILGVNSGASISGNVTTGLITCTVTGGTAPYTYAWEQVSGTSLISIDDAADDDTTFTVTGAFDSITYDGSFRCKVTDANGAVAYTGEVSVEIYWISTL